jgi:hypothetical protein
MRGKNISFVFPELRTFLTPQIGPSLGTIGGLGFSLPLGSVKLKQQCRFWPKNLNLAKAVVDFMDILADNMPSFREVYLVQSLAPRL